MAAGLLMLAQACSSAAQGQWGLAALLTAVLGLAAPGTWRDIALKGTHRPRELERRGDGRLWLHRRNTAEPVWPAPASLKWGRALLLVLRGSRTTWLWLGPDNLPAAVLADLRRELARGEGRARRPVA